MNKPLYILITFTIVFTIKVVNCENIKTILKWMTPRTSLYFDTIRNGHQAFLNAHCKYTNCYMTSNKRLLADYTLFDFVLFDAKVLSKAVEWPKRRSPHQKYIFVSPEPADYYPICDRHFNNYFNLTWTYKLNSDLPFEYFVIRDANFNVIGPKVDMEWIKLEDMADISEDLKKQLKSKTKAAVWMVSRCDSRSNREDFVARVRYELLEYGLYVDVYGECGSIACPLSTMEKCLKIQEKHYYFYFSFENSFCDDYVTEKLLFPLRFNMVPIVYGGADYSRFLPDGVYLNARDLGPKRLAATIYRAIKYPQKYYKFFRWKKYYSFFARYEHPETDSFCSLCSYLNNQKLMEQRSVCDDFVTWWTPPGRQCD